MWSMNQGLGGVFPVVAHLFPLGLAAVTTLIGPVEAVVAGLAGAWVLQGSEPAGGYAIQSGRGPLTVRRAQPQSHIVRGRGRRSFYGVERVKPQAPDPIKHLDQASRPSISIKRLDHGWKIPKPVAVF
jgi:hypothetical protein